jgi:archaeosine-15-forming tRNA-guanine transglycosylase
VVKMTEQPTHLKGLEEIERTSIPGLVEVLREELLLAQERERAERYRSVYTSLGLRVIVHKDGTLELTWRAGKGVSEVCASPRCTASATTSSSSTPARSKGRT